MIRGKRYSASEIADMKKRFLEKLNENLGIQQPALDAIGISRNVILDWRAKDNEFADAFNAITEKQGDFVESKLLKTIKDGDTTAIIFYCKTKLKNRGYVERHEVQADVQTHEPSVIEFK